MKFPFQDLNDGKTDCCQISGEKNLVEFIDLGSQPLSDTLIERKNLEKKEKFFELKILNFEFFYLFIFLFSKLKRFFSA